SNHPNWPWQAAVGVLLAAAVFGAAQFARRGSEPALAAWIAVNADAAGAGGLIGWAIENLPIESLGSGGWLRGICFAVLAVAAPIVGAAALVQAKPAPAFAAVL